MDKKHWFRDLLKLIVISTQIYLDSSNKLHNLELFIKKLLKNLVILIVLLIPLCLSIWASICISLYFYLSTKLILANYIITLIIALINLLILLIMIVWFKSKFRDYQIAKTSGINLVLIKLLRSLRTLERDA